MSTRRTHHALRGALALASALQLSACALTIGAPPGDRTAAAPARRAPAQPATIRLGPPEAPAPRPAYAAEVATTELAAGASLLIPVQGIRPEQLYDSYQDPRSGGRTHHAIDIMAPGGTPVVAAADGTVHRLRTGGLGGITIYQVGQDGRTLYYYAHLQRYAAGLREGLSIKRGQVIAYVGDTGNAGTGNYHLHFSVGEITDMNRWWDSRNVNPYPLLTGSGAHTRRAEARD